MIVGSGVMGSATQNSDSEICDGCSLFVGVSLATPDWDDDRFALSSPVFLQQLWVLGSNDFSNILLWNRPGPGTKSMAGYN